MHQILAGRVGGIIDLEWLGAVGSDRTGAVEVAIYIDDAGAACPPWAAMTTAPLVAELLVATMAAPSLVSVPELITAQTPIPSSAVPNTPVFCVAPESPQTPTPAKLLSPLLLMLPAIPLIATPLVLDVLAFTPNVASELLESVLLTVSAVELVPAAPGIVTDMLPPGAITTWSLFPSRIWNLPPVGRLMNVFMPSPTRL